MWGDGAGRSEVRPSAEALRASLGRELRYLLTIGIDAGKVTWITPAGITHSIGVCLIEDWNMARGKTPGRAVSNTTTMPRFVDVKLTQEDREAFISWSRLGGDRVVELQQFADSGYRVGVTWSGEHQAYTVSVTCRDEQSDNNGLCMTSFAGDLRQAIALAWYKHEVVCEFAWKKYAPKPEEAFG